MKVEMLSLIFPASWTQAYHFKFLNKVRLGRYLKDKYYSLKNLLDIFNAY